ncbi:MAG TPA: TetR/AcrR family transcriptional regulator [Stellaceae bacterium]|jgi:AcrR family transcriptional regulator|nr:TetR/AcrR family transcriptional regulator [Stellaceae bacterium]
MEKASATRERILRHGLMLLSQAGLQGVTLGVLADRVGMSKSGLFAHFRSIEEVQIALLRHTAEIAGQNVVAPAMRATEGLGRLEALVRHWLGWSGKAGLGGGCPIAASMFEYDDVEGPVRDEALALERRWRALLASLVRQAIDSGELRPGLDVDQFVWELCGIYLSHHASLRFVRDVAADRRARLAVDALIERACASPVKRGARGSRRRKAKPKR